MFKRKQGLVRGGAVGLPSGTGCSEATLAARLASEEGSHMDFWENWDRGHCPRQAEVGQGAVKRPVRLEGAGGEWEEWRAGR